MSTYSVVEDGKQIATSLVCMEQRSFGKKIPPGASITSLRPAQWGLRPGSMVRK
jgi:hypothetical protein